MKRDVLGETSGNFVQCAEKFRAAIGRVTKREWSLVVAGVSIVILFATAIICIEFSALRWPQNIDRYWISPDTAIRAILGFSLIFCTYIVSQHLLVYRLTVRVDSHMQIVDEQAHQLAKSIAHDPVTSLLSRHLGENRVFEEMARAKRQESPLTVLRLNLCGIKEIGDQLGRQTKEAALRAFSEHLRRKLRCCDIAFSLEEGSFLVALPECNIEKAKSALRRINQVTFEFPKNRRTQVVSGVADHIHGESLPTLLMRAESTLHHDDSDETTGLPLPKVLIAVNETITEKDQRFESLSSTHRKVLKLLAVGKSNKEIANALGLSVRTVEKYRMHIMEALDVHSIQELMLFAFRVGIVDVA